MENEATSPSRSGRSVGVAGLLMALCCLAGPAILGVAAGAALGNVLGIAAAIVIALAVVLVVRRWRAGSDKAC